MTASGDLCDRSLLFRTESVRSYSRSIGNSPRIVRQTVEQGVRNSFDQFGVINPLPPDQAPTPPTRLPHHVPGLATYPREHQQTDSGDLCDRTLLYGFEAGSRI